MTIEKIKNKGQAQIFKNQYLEYLTKTHPMVIWGLYLPVIVLLLLFSFNRTGLSFIQISLLFLAGVFFWTFFEYMMHRFVFHWTSDSPKIQRLSYILHGNHHEFPRDKQRLFMPPVPSIILAGIVFGIMYSVLKSFTFPFFPGFLMGYLLYGSMHYAIHAWKPPFAWMKPIWRNHHLHHYKNDHQGFGVSTHFWDRLFRTGFDLQKEIENKEEVAKLTYVRKNIYSAEKK